jgi:hypothetical protein
MKWWLAIAIALALGACRHKAPIKSTTTLVVHVLGEDGPAGARIVLFDAQNQPVRFGTLDLYGKRQATTAVPFDPGTLGTWDGIIVAYGVAEIPIGSQVPYGHYHVWAWRGIEYERWEGDVDLSAELGRVELEIHLQRAWTPHGTLAADLHVHAHASNDSGLPNPQRVIAQVAAGIQVIGLSDHNANGDLTTEIKDLHLDDRVVSIASNELTADAMHLGVYPVPPRTPAPKLVPNQSVQEMFDIAHAFPNHPVVQLNHPRFRFTALYDGTNWNGVTWPPPFPLAFDAVEVLAGYSAFNDKTDRRFDESVRDFYTLVDHGHLVTPLGNSDTHDLNWVLDGTARNYVYVDDPRVQPFDEDGFVRAIRARRVVATTGPWLDVEASAQDNDGKTVGPGQVLVAHRQPGETTKVWLTVSVTAAKFMHVDKIRITVGEDSGPRMVQEVDARGAEPTVGWSGPIAIGEHDTWIGVTAEGDTALPKEITGSYQQDKWNRPGVTPFAIASPILIDVDGDGHWKRGDADIPLH